VRNLSILRPRVASSPLAIEKEIPVDTAWDLGRTDSTSIWFIQRLGREYRLVDLRVPVLRFITTLNCWGKKASTQMDVRPAFFPARHQTKRVAIGEISD
jgi:hypothetical protein